MNWTPGPWNFQKQPYVRGFSDAWDVWQDSTEERDGHVVAHCLDESNARLIAAAPLLADVIDAVICARLEHLNPSEYYKAMDKISDRARAALKAARGES